jgi:hypothetical protein
LLIGFEVASRSISDAITNFNGLIAICQGERL